MRRPKGWSKTTGQKLLWVAWIGSGAVWLWFLLKIWWPGPAANLKEFESLHTLYLLSQGETFNRDFFHTDGPLYYSFLQPFFSFFGGGFSFLFTGRAIQTGIILLLLALVATVFRLRFDSWRVGFTGAFWLAFSPTIWGEGLRLNPVPIGIIFLLASLAAMEMGYRRGPYLPWLLASGVLAGISIQFSWYFIFPVLFSLLSALAGGLLRKEWKGGLAALLAGVATAAAGAIVFLLMRVETQWGDIDAYIRYIRTCLAGGTAAPKYGLTLVVRDNLLLLSAAAWSLINAHRKESFLEELPLRFGILGMFLGGAFAASPLVNVSNLPDSFLLMLVLAGGFAGWAANAFWTAIERANFPRALAGFALVAFLPWNLWLAGHPLWFPPPEERSVPDFAMYLPTQTLEWQMREMDFVAQNVGPSQGVFPTQAGYYAMHRNFRPAFWSYGSSMMEECRRDWELETHRILRDPDCVLVPYSGDIRVASEPLLRELFTHFELSPKEGWLQRRRYAEE